MCNYSNQWFVAVQFHCVQANSIDGLDLWLQTSAKKSVWLLSESHRADSNIFIECIIIITSNLISNMVISIPHFPQSKSMLKNIYIYVLFAAFDGAVVALASPIAIAIRAPASRIDAFRKYIFQNNNNHGESRIKIALAWIPSVSGAYMSSNRWPTFARIWAMAKQRVHLYIRHAIDVNWSEIA